MFRNLISYFFLSTLIIYSAQLSAEPSALSSFKVDTWKKILSEAKGHQVVVFSSTDCTHCPGVINQLSLDLKKSKTKIKLIAVVMDGFDHPDYVLSAPHYLSADQIYAFDGKSVPLRYAVNPDWKGVTPYVVFLKPKSIPTYVVGRPTNQQIDQFINF